MNDPSRHEGLRTARIEMRLSQQEFADLLERLSRANGEPVECSVRLVRRWENGEVTRPRPVFQRLLEQATGRTLAQLGFADTPPAPAAPAEPPAPPPAPATAPAPPAPSTDPSSGAPAPPPRTARGLPGRVALLVRAFGERQLAVLSVGLLSSLVSVGVLVAVVWLGLQSATADRTRAPLVTPTQLGVPPAGSGPDRYAVRIYGPATLAPGQRGLYYAAVPPGTPFHWTVDGADAGAQLPVLPVTLRSGQPAVTLSVVLDLPSGTAGGSTLTVAQAEP
ncbi:multiprotein-bridging factor 1 family protein [Kitasatospora sp. NPDC058965]|uniref:helix-turn-helix domain-containing protein n=1 Tax=Kitasatospora sp. NPDC058965 TaxID=3346682 RepID=UPI0036CB1779